MGRGPAVLLWLAGGPPSAAGQARCLVYRWSPSLAASYLIQEGSAAEH